MQKKKIHQEFDLIVHICESNYVLVLIFPLRSSTHILFLLFLHISPKTLSSSVSKINCFYRKLKSESKSVRFLSRIFHDYAIKHNRDSLRSHNNCLFILLSLSHIDTSCAKENRENEVFFFLLFMGHDRLFFVAPATRALAPLQLTTPQRSYAFLFHQRSACQVFQS